MRVEEKYGSFYLMDEDDIVYEIVEPMVLFYRDNGLCTILKFGNKEVVSGIYKERVDRAVRAGCPEITEDYVLADLPKDLDVLNKVLSNSQYLNTLFKDTF